MSCKWRTLVWNLCSVLLQYQWKTFMWLNLNRPRRRSGSRYSAGVMRVNSEITALVLSGS